jgi:hypothetical protein
MRIYDDEQGDEIIPQIPQAKKSLQDEIRDELHTNESRINPTLKAPFVPPPDPRDPTFVPNLEERAQRIIAAGLMDENPCTAHLHILQTAFPEIPSARYPWVALQTWFYSKDWRRSKKTETGFNPEQPSEIFQAVTRLQTAAVKYINQHRIPVPADPRFDIRAELQARM